MNDLISRQAAIDAMEQAKEQYFDRRVIIGKMQNVVSNLPSAQPERKKGEWIETEFLKLRECSCCHVRWGMYDVENFNFCPNCGADIRGEQDD